MTSINQRSDASEHGDRSISKVVLILIDVINDFDFEQGEELLKRAIPAAANILKLKECAAKIGISSVYVNDNFGRWQSDFRAQVDRCLLAESEERSPKC